MNKIKGKFNKSQIYLSAGSHFITDIYQSFIIGLIPVLTLKFELSLINYELILLILTFLLLTIFPVIGKRYRTLFPSTSPILIRFVPFGILRFNKINTLMNISLLLIIGDEKYSGLSVDILV